MNGAFQGGFTVFTVGQPNDGDPNRDELWFGVLDPAAGTPSRFVQGTDGPIPTHEQRDDHVGKDHDVPKRENRI